MKKLELATRWRALHGLRKGFTGKPKRVLVNRNTWLLVTAIFRALVWIARLIQQIM